MITKLVARNKEGSEPPYSDNPARRQRPETRLSQRRGMPTSPSRLARPGSTGWTSLL